jgi:hypothetical protein
LLLLTSRPFWSRARISPVDGLRDFIGYVKRNANTVRMGSAGIGATGFVDCAIFNGSRNHQKLHDATVAAMETPWVLDQLAKNGTYVVPPERRSTAYFESIIGPEIKKSRTANRGGDVSRLTAAGLRVMTVDASNSAVADNSTNAAHNGPRRLRCWLAVPAFGVDALTDAWRFHETADGGCT